MECLILVHLPRELMVLPVISVNWRGSVVHEDTVAQI